jgi:biotin carboxyl carrier protein
MGTVDRLADVMGRTTHTVHLGNERFAVEIGEDRELRIAGFDGAWTVNPTGDGAFLVGQGERRRHVFVAADGDRVQAFVDGEVYDLLVEREGRAPRAAGRVHEPLTVPMPARVVRIFVAEGQAITRGDLLMTLEAMKMQLPLKAPRDGTVRKISCREGDLVQPGAPVVEIA